MQTLSNKAQQNEQLDTDIMTLIKDQDEYTIGALMTLYNYQTYDEQLSNSAIHDNNLGFNSLDTTILSSMVRYYQNNGLLTPKQIAFVRRTIPKYHNQLVNANIKPLPIKNDKTQNQDTKSIKWAGSLDGGKKISIKFSFPKGDPQFRETLDKVKTLSGRRWNPDDKTWSCYCTIDNLESLIEWKFGVAPKLKEWYEKMDYSSVEKDIDIPGLGMELYPFQKDGVAFVNSRRGRALIGDSMGLGKTAQALAWLQFNKEIAFPALVICPASVKFNWKRECKMWVSDLSVQLISGRTPIEIPDTDIIISNYDILADQSKEAKDKQGKITKTTHGWGTFLSKTKKLKTLIIDEIHYLKESKTLRTKAVRKLAKQIPHVIGLSGTPITNRPVEFFNCLNMIAPERFPSYWEYVQHFCDAKHNGWGWDFSGSSHTDELHKRVCKIMIRRKKEDVLKDLPPKIRSVIPLEINNRSEYAKAEEDFIGWVKETHGKEKAINAENAQALAQIEGLKQLTIKGKMDSVIKWITDFLNSGQKLVVFCTHHKTIDDLIAHFKEISVKLDGRDNLKARQTAIDAFQTLDNIRLFIGNTKAAGIGINLFAASCVCFIELSWSPSEHLQAEDRIHRIGQKAESINVYYLYAHNTIEEKIVALLNKKQKILDSVLDGEKLEIGSSLIEIIEEIKNNPRGLDFS